MTHFAFDFGFGAQLRNDGATHFRLWAPDCSDVRLEFGDGRTMALHGIDEGWFETTVNAPAGTRYRYRLNGASDVRVPDIASRAQLGGVHGWSVVVDPRSYEWRHGDWKGRPWHESIIEEIHVGLLDGYDGVRNKLPQLAESGITAIELMPIAEFPGTRNWGYDGVLPFAPDAVYGAPNALKALIDDAHGRGMIVLLDIVYNHFGPEGNYLPRYASSFFRKGTSTPWGPAVDIRKQPVSEFFIANALYWINEYRFDGLRFDAAHAIIDQGWLLDFAARIRSRTDGRHVHLVLEHEDNAANLLDHGFDAQWDDDFHHALHVLLTGEKAGYYADYAGAPIELLARAWSEGFAWQGEPAAYRNGAPRGQPSAHLPPTAFVAYLQNHDQIGNRAFGERLATLVAPELLGAAIAFVLLSPTIPMLFMGEDYGEQNPFLYFTDYSDGLATAVRDGRRKEFAKFPEFNDPAKRARIPDPNDAATFAASRPNPKNADTAVRERIRQLVELRKREIIPWLDRKSTRRAEVLGAKALHTRWRRDDGTTLHLCANFGNEPIAAPAVSHALLYSASNEATESIRRGRLEPAGLIAWID
ncbi:MAG TPA: malto-oligosyltrehalose trehalohydrolase [Rudaea sp.]|nr:malto-oligosyltrehalose trehalohydrolase [Rudaea sp.]